MNIQQDEIKKIIEKVVSELSPELAEYKNSAQSPHHSFAKSAISKSPVQNVSGSINDEAVLADITKIDIRTQYLVENPENAQEYAALKAHAPCRLGIGKSGARYKTLPMLQFRAAHSAAQDAVFRDVDEDFIKSKELFIVQSQCNNKDTYLTRPDLGRKLNADGVKIIKEKCKKNPRVQVYVSDGLSSAAVSANISDVLPGLMQGLASYNIDVGTPFFVKYGRVGVMDEISEITEAEVTCVLIGERPGLITAESMSAYIVYKGTVGMPESRRTVLSNIHSSGTNQVEAGAHIAEIIKIMLERKQSGVDLKL